jgi:glycosyltransferase involved in cell wall biosynthesis
VPDPAAVGQHMADAAVELAGRGHRVVVLTSDRGYDDPSVRYPRRETLGGVDVRRIPLTSFGKRSMVVRLLGGVSFTIQSIARGLFLRPLDAIVVSTAPPMASVAAVVIGALRRTPIKYWVMDLNPDQSIALGVVRDRSLLARAFDRLNRLVLRRASDVVVLDRFMAERVNRKVDVRAKLAIIPPWPHEDHLAEIRHEDNPFRRRHGLDEKRVVMYSGNHGPSNPIGTVLQAAQRLADRPDIVFLFVGGGVGKAEVDEVAGPAIKSLPYQPLEQLKYSLSAADVHLVTVGDAVVGIVHPSKVYGALAVGRPILLLGPEQSHVGEMIRDHDIGWRISHGDVDGAEAVLRRIADIPVAELAAKGARAKALVSTLLGKAELCGRLCDVVERGVGDGVSRA